MVAAITADANWIWDSGPQQPVNHYMYIRREIDIPTNPLKVVVHVSADSRYKLYVNGKMVGRGPVRSDPRWQHYDTYDLTKSFRKGRNSIAALVHHYGTDTFTYHLGRGGFLLDGRVSYIKPPSSETQTLSIVSDDSWRVRPSDAWYRNIPRISVQQEFYEVYDANKAPDGWTGVGFDDSAWERATVIGKPGMDPWPNLTARQIPFLYEKEVYPVEITQVGVADPSGLDLPKDNKRPIAFIMSHEKKTASSEPEGLAANSYSLCCNPSIEELFDTQPINPHGRKEAEALKEWRRVNEVMGVCTVWPLPPEERAAGKAPYLVLDFGREIAGMPRIKVSTEGRGIIDLGYGELLEGGNVHPHRHGVNYADRYVMKPGEQEWEVFDRRAFRYMQIDFRDITEPVTVESVSVLFNTYPVEWKGEFECSDKRLNEIWRIGAYTVQLNMEDAYTDCPWRERTQWWGDARIEAMSNYYAFGDYKLMRQGIIQIGQSQREDGRTACFYPGVFWDYIPSFCLIWVGSIWDYYVYTGDVELVRETYPKVEKLIGYFEKFRDKNGLLSDVPGWMFIEWTQQEYEGSVSALNCFYYETLTHASNMARLSGDTEGIEKYASMASALKESINTHLFDPERGVYPEYWSEKKQAFSPKTSQMVNGLVAAFDIAPEQRRSDVLRHCMDPDSGVVPVGSYFAYYYLQALLQNGYVQEAVDYMRKNWGVMLDWGATTFWEHWNTNSSLCHGWASSPTIYLPAYILGVRPAEPGYRRVTIAPNTADIGWTRGTVPTPLGDIRAEWKKTGSAFEMTVFLPKGMAAEVSLPVASRSVLMNGKEVAAIVQDGRATIALEKAGEYTFAVRSTDQPTN